MTPQQIFDAVVAHARQQPERALNEFGHCRYRDHYGRKCFVGALIPDELYQPRMENQSVEAVFEFFPEVEAHIIQDDQEHKSSIKFLLIKLQDIHDYYTPEVWEDKFRDLAQQSNLTYTPPEAA